MIKYIEYVAAEGNMLLELNGFTIGNKIICKPETNLSLIEVSKEDAKYFNDLYKNGINTIRETINKTENNEDEYSTMTLDENNIYVENNSVSNEEEQINELKSKLIQDIINKGYSIGKAINKIEH